MKEFIAYFLLVLCTISLMGCASIVSDSKYPVTVSSSPGQANITIKDDTGRKIYTGTTPTTITLEASEGFFQAAEYRVKLSKEGYNTRSTVILAGLDGWYIGNLVFGGFIGWLIVDPATGAMWKLNNNKNIDLSKKETVSFNQKRLNILSIEQIPEKFKSNLIKIN